MTLPTRLLALLILLVGLAGVVVVAASTFAIREKRTSLSTGPALTAVEVDLESGRVDVVATTDLEPRVVRTTRWLVGEPELQESLVDGVLRLTADCPRLVAPACQVRYRLELPATIAVRVRTDRGTVSVDGMAGEVDVASEAGRISLARTSGPVLARTAAGDIDGVDLSPRFFDASTRAGRIRLSLAKPSERVDLRTQAGGIDLTLPGDRYRVEAESGAGRVEVGVTRDPGSPYVVRARTEAGSIRIRPR